jgi:hypothetical protein
MREGLIERIRDGVTFPSQVVDSGILLPPGKAEELKQAFEAAVTNISQRLAQSDEIRIADIRQESTNRATVFITEAFDQPPAEGTSGRPTRIIHPVEFRWINGE